MPALETVAYWATTALLSFTALNSIGSRGCGRDGTFCPSACAHLQNNLAENLFGQEFASSQLLDAICDHLTEEQPEAPLVLSLHGPPGVGKSYFHHLLAESLYNITYSPGSSCPGSSCPGYRVVYGTDYISEEKERQMALLRDASLKQLTLYPESLLVIEEYDKMDCQSRGLFKQIMERGATEEAEFRRSIVILEANVGWLQMHSMLETAGDRAALSMEQAQRHLKEAVFTKWVAEGCEDSVDTTRTLSLIRMVVPFLPLEKSHMADVLAALLRRKGERESAQGGLARLEWQHQVPAWLASKADYDGKYTIEGAKEAQGILSRHVSRAIRRYQQHDPREQMDSSNGEGDTRDRVWARHLAIVELRIIQDGSSLEAVAIGTVNDQAESM